MPFSLLKVEPEHVSRCKVSSKEPNELEALSNSTLANLIRQISSLGENASKIFDELSKDIVKINNRSQALNQRIQRLSDYCSKLDTKNEKVTFEETSKKPFKSSIVIEQKILKKESMPEALRILYEKAEPPPELFKFNQFRDDDAMKQYTDPSFFFYSWSDNMMKIKNNRINARGKKKTVKLQNTQDPVQNKSLDQNEAISNLPPPPQELLNDNEETSKNFHSVDSANSNQNKTIGDPNSFYVNYENEAQNDPNSSYVNSTELIEGSSSQIDFKPPEPSVLSVLNQMNQINEEIDDDDDSDWD